MKREEKKIWVTQRMLKSLTHVLREQASDTIPDTLDLWPELQLELERRFVPERVAITAFYEEYIESVEEKTMEANQVWVWLRCYKDHEPEAANDLRTTFATAGIAEQLLDVIVSPNMKWTKEEKELELRQPPLFESRLLAKVAKTDETAEVLRSGVRSVPGRSSAYSGWEIMSTGKEGSSKPQSATQQAVQKDIPFKIHDRVRLLTWPFEGFSGDVLVVLNHLGKVAVRIDNSGRIIDLHLEPDEIVREEEDPRKAWYVLFTEPGYEELLRDRLHKRLAEHGLLYRLFDVVIPGQGQNHIPMMRDGKVRMVNPTLFPGSVFVLMSLDARTWQVVRNIPGLTGFVGKGDKPLAYPPAPIPPGTAKAAATLPFAPGDRVRILSGPYNNSRGIVIEVDTELLKLRVMIDFFGNPINKELDLDQVEKE